MKEKFTMDKYADLLEKDIKQATLYKDKFVPDRLYKYQPLGLGRMRSKRIQTIKKEEIWASRVEYLNDPFEFKMLYTNQELADVEEFYEDVLNRNEVICLSGKWNDKLMWSHYADSHRGICVEYKFDWNNKNYVFPVAYVGARQCYDTELREWLDNENQAVEQILAGGALTGKQKKQMYLCSKIMYIKDQVWEYEKEYRIVTRNHNNIIDNKFDDYKIQHGSLHKVEKFGLKLSKIYLGMNCLMEDKKNIIAAVNYVNDNRVKKAIGRSRKDRKVMYQTLKELDEIVTVWQIYSDDKLRLRTYQL